MEAYLFFSAIRLGQYTLQPIPTPEKPEKMAIKAQSNTLCRNLSLCFATIGLLRLFQIKASNSI
jgi:hypothetical protein